MVERRGLFVSTCFSDASIECVYDVLGKVMFSGCHLWIFA